MFNDSSSKNDKIKKLKDGGTVARESLISILCVYLKTSLFCCCPLHFSGNSRGTGLDIAVSIQVKGGSSKTFQASSNRNLDFTKWHKVAVRIQDTQSLLRVFVDDVMVHVYSFKFQIDTYPQNAQLRLAQVYEVYLENTGQITSRFKVRCKNT